MPPDRDQDHHSLLWNRVVRVLCDLQTAFPYHDHHRSAYDHYDDPSADDHDHHHPYDNDSPTYDNDIHDKATADNTYDSATAHNTHNAASFSDAAHNDHHAAADDYHDRSPTAYNHVYDDSGGLVGRV